MNLKLIFKASLNLIFFKYLWILCMLTQVRMTHSSQCSIPLTKTLYVYINETLPHNYRVKRSQGLRIQVHYDEHVRRLWNFHHIKKYLFEDAIKYWQDTLVPNKPNVNPILVPRSCKNNRGYIIDDRIVCSKGCEAETYCSVMRIPEKFLDKCLYSDNGYYAKSRLSPGVGATNSDLLLLVTSTNKKCSGSTLAYATHCYLQKNDDRPLVGMINICSYSKLTRVTIRHEIGHILGFNDGLYMYYRDDEGKPLTKRNSDGHPQYFEKYDNYYPIDRSTVVLENINSQKRTSPFLITPAIKKLVQEYFRCPRAIGIPLELYSIPHFKESIFGDELMTPFVSSISKVSLFTLTVLEDTGWYVVNKRNVEPYNIGRNVGCNLLQVPCPDSRKIQNRINRRVKPYCGLDRDKLFCSSSKRSVVWCNADLNNTAKLIHTIQDNFNLNKTGGCPYLRVHRNCKDSSNNNELSTFSKNLRGEYFGKKSRCIQSSGIITVMLNGSVKQDIVQGAGCYKITCHRKMKKFTITVHSKNVVCRFGGQKVNITSRIGDNYMTGNLICPGFGEVCVRTPYF